MEGKEKYLHTYISMTMCYSNVVPIPTLCKTSDAEGSRFHLASRLKSHAK